MVEPINAGVIARIEKDSFPAISTSAEKPQSLDIEP